MRSFALGATLLASTFLSGTVAAPQFPGHGNGNSNGNDNGSGSDHGHGNGTGVTGQLVTYWGQGPNQKSLDEFCSDSTIDIIPIGFVNKFPGQDGTYGLPGTNFGNACDADEYYVNAQGQTTSIFSECKRITPAMKTCQANGKKIFVSLGGDSPGNQLASEADAKSFATQLWEIFGPKKADYTGPRPFGDNVVDGFDFDIESGDGAYLSTLANELRNYFSQDSSKTYYLSAAPQCIVPDAHLSAALSGAKFDYVFVQFYNTAQCSARSYFDPTDENADISWDAWVEFIRQNSANPSAKLFLGLPASPAAVPSAPNDYLNLDEANELITLYSCSESYKSGYGGVMLYDATYSDQNEENDRSYAANIKSIMINARLDSTSTSSSYTSTSTSASSSTLSSTASTTADATFTSTLTTSTSETTSSATSTSSESTNTSTTSSSSSETTSTGFSTSIGPVVGSTSTSSDSSSTSTTESTSTSETSTTETTSSTTTDSTSSSTTSSDLTSSTSATTESTSTTASSLTTTSSGTTTIFTPPFSPTATVTPEFIMYFDDLSGRRKLSRRVLRYVAFVNGIAVGVNSAREATPMYIDGDDNLRVGTKYVHVDGLATRNSATLTLEDSPALPAGNWDREPEGGILYFNTYGWCYNTDGTVGLFLIAAGVPPGCENVSVKSVETSQIFTTTINTNTLTSSSTVSTISTPPFTIAPTTLTTTTTTDTTSTTTSASSSDTTTTTTILSTATTTSTSTATTSSTTSTTAGSSSSIGPILGSTTSSSSTTTSSVTTTSFSTSTGTSSSSSTSTSTTSPDVGPIFTNATSSTTASSTSSSTSTGSSSSTSITSPDVGPILASTTSSTSSSSSSTTSPAIGPILTGTSSSTSTSSTSYSGVGPVLTSTTSTTSSSHYYSSSSSSSKYATSAVTTKSSAKNGHWEDWQSGSVADPAKATTSAGWPGKSSATKDAAGSGATHAEWANWSKVGPVTAKPTNTAMPVPDVWVTKRVTAVTYVCPTGFTVRPFTWIETITIDGNAKPTAAPWPTQKNGVPEGFMVTVTVCEKGCAAKPTTVTLTVPIATTTQVATATIVPVAIWDTIKGSNVVDAQGAAPTKGNGDDLAWDEWYTGSMTGGAAATQTVDLVTAYGGWSAKQSGAAAASAGWDSKAGGAAASAGWDSKQGGDAKQGGGAAQGGDAKQGEWATKAGDVAVQGTTTVNVVPATAAPSKWIPDVTPFTGGAPADQLPGTVLSVVVCVGVAVVGLFL